MPAPQKSRLRPQVIPLSDPEAISRLEQLQNSESQRRFAYQLGLLQPGHPQAVATLLKLMLTPQPARFYRRNAEYLQRITPPEQLTQIIPSLRQQAELIESGVRTEQALECYRLLWHCAQTLPQPQFQQAEAAESG